MGSKRVIRSESKFIRYMKGPIRVLARVRDLYVQSMMGCGGHVNYGNAMGCPTPQIPRLPKSFSSSHINYKTAEEELRELIRLASTRNLTGKIEAELLRSKRPPSHGVTRSHTVAFGRIDEDRAVEFGDEEDVGLLGGGAYPRSRSYAVLRRSKVA
ncbi:uncharacterized protein LOC105177838 [Sesamum indicum]|uniref:Uncharacterized protein LOC105177838 n=1 Tax=Sesamum indicum TaxID=4182 RepID=A0A6I9UK33_SESIN|nr:uncharacterized protein LOC105177838 [Sesamum indicum]